ncbi:thioredoxin family protein [Tateyamaria pelophila]|uniref:thioredoxin family protein n=1 Tax=Tateyamaria pelophila TaxID=328415 RepID=UPI001CC05802|nr:thioredoxin family protein [Tateyamaria pelophila]
MQIKILGTGCKKCVALADNAKAAAQTAGIDFEIEKVTDIVTIAGYGVMSTPGLVLNDKVVSAGRVLSVQEIAPLMAQAES